MQRDAAAARQYYETAANLGDSDAMNEAAWCYLEGFGGKKDKVGTYYCTSGLSCRAGDVIMVWQLARALRACWGLVRRGID